MQWGRSIAMKENNGSLFPNPYWEHFIPATFSQLRFHFGERTYYFIEKKNCQAYEKLFLLFLASVQFSFRKKNTS